MPSNRGTGSAACGAVDCKRVRMPHGGVPRVTEDAVGVTVTLVIGKLGIGGLAGLLYTGIPTLGMVGYWSMGSTST